MRGAVSVPRANTRPELAGAMHKALGIFIGFAVGFLSLEFKFSSNLSDDYLHSRLSFAVPAHAQFNGNCEYPPVDEPDGDGDECNPNYLAQVIILKNQGDPGA